MSNPGTVDPAQLLALGGQVRDAAGAIEQAFLMAGNGLGDGLAALDTVLASVEAIPRDLAGEDMQEASRTLARTSAELSELAAALPGEKEALDRITLQLEPLRAPLERLVESIRTIAILARSARVETACLSINDLDFTAFSEEILALADEARSGMNAFVRSFAGLTRQLRTTREEQSEFFERRHGQIETSVGELRSAFAAIQARQREAISASAVLGRVSRSAAEAVGNAIIALQAGDGTRQRLEHIDQALSELASRMADGRTSRAGCALQHAQLSHALKEFGAEVEEIRRSLTSIGVSTDEITALGQELVSADASASTLQERLQNQLGVAVALVRECEAGRESVDAALASLSATLRSFRNGMEALQRISASITTIGINAAIRSYRLGTEGRALSVISQDLRAYAQRIVEDTQDFVAAFDGVLALADSVDKARDGRAALSMARVEAELSGMTAILQDKDRRLSGALAGVRASGAQVEAALARARASFANLADAMEPAHRAQAQLASLGRDADPAIIATLGGWERYTMAREREIHQDMAHSLALAG